MKNLAKDIEDLRQLVIRNGSLENYRTMKYILEVIIPTLARMEEAFERIENEMLKVEEAFETCIETFDNEPAIIVPNQKLII